MYRSLFRAVGVFVILIGGVLIVSPNAYMMVYATDYQTGMDFPARRFAPALLALGVVLILAAQLPASQFVRRLCFVSGATFLAVAATVVHAWLSGIATRGILFATGFEVLVSGLFFLSGKRIVPVANTFE